MTSDFDSALTPQPPTPRSITDCSTQTTWSEYSFYDDGEGNIDNLESIGHRTRSKFSLSHTEVETIEQAFIPPDITTDMYELNCDNEDWKQFLQEFTKPLSKFCSPFSGTIINIIVFKVLFSLLLFIICFNTLC